MLRNLLNPAIFVTRSSRVFTCRRVRRVEVRGHRLKGRGLSLYLIVVSFEQGQERGLGAGGALDPSESEARVETFDLLKVNEQILYPESGSLAHGGQLRWSEKEVKVNQ